MPPTLRQYLRERVGLSRGQLANVSRMVNRGENSRAINPVLRRYGAGPGQVRRASVIRRTDLKERAGDAFETKIGSRPRYMDAASEKDQQLMVNGTPSQLIAQASRKPWKNMHGHKVNPFWYHGT